jgi:serine/threonine protein kinase
VPELDVNELDFTKKCLAIDPKKRWSAVQLLSHQYLVGLEETSTQPEPTIVDKIQHDTIVEITEESENDRSSKIES